MLAPSSLRIPEQYAAWNREHGAPSGKFREKRIFLKPYVSADRWLRWAGPFSIQGNNSSRMFEYPWAYWATSLCPGKEILEIGGGLSGFQFVLDQAGCHVTNLDPGMEQLNFLCNQEMLGKLNRIFRTSVKLVNEPAESAEFPPNHFDRIFSISVLEHFSPVQLEKTMQSIRRWLKPGGFLVCTIDLFLNLCPFTERQSNEYGINQNIFNLVRDSGLELEVGNRDELYGFPEFDAGAILANLEKYWLGSYPTLTQCLVLRKA